MNHLICTQCGLTDEGGNPLRGCANHVDGHHNWGCQHLSYQRNPEDIGGANCEDCGEEAPCQWFEAIGTENRQCDGRADVEIKIRYTDEDDNDTEEPFILWLCQKHGKRLALERAGSTISEKYLDEPLIREEP